MYYLQNLKGLICSQVYHLFYTFNILMTPTQIHTISYNPFIQDKIMNRDT